MRVSNTVLLLLLGAIMAGAIPSCSKKQAEDSEKVTSRTPEETAALRRKYARNAGETATLAYLSIDKPTLEQVKLLQTVVEKLGQNLTKYAEGGFAATLPGIQEAIERSLPGEKYKAERLLANKLAKTLVEELDRLFEKNPKWRALGGEVAELLAVFFKASKESFDAYAT